MRLAVIGTAGRNEDGEKLSRSIYVKMFHFAKGLIHSNTFGELKDLELVSGGAAWADHIAVSLHKDMGTPLTLFLPASWDLENHCFFGNPAASTANYYHRKFSKKVGVDTLFGLHQAMMDTTTVTSWINLRGFLARNLEVAGRADAVLAFTFGEGTQPKDGGTKHTWDRCEGKLRIHVPISKL